MEKKEHILELELPSKIYFWILVYNNKKEPISAYKIGKLIYRSQSFTALPKIYSYLKKLKKLGLITTESKEIKGRTVKILKPNLIKFFQDFNEIKLPEKYRLDEKEIEILAKWFENIDLEKALNLESHTLMPIAERVREEAGELNVFDQIAMLLKAGAILVKGLRNSKRKMDEFLNVLKNTLPDLYEIIKVYEPFSSLPNQICEKLEHLEIPPVIENLLMFAWLTYQYLSDFISQEKKQ